MNTTTNTTTVNTTKVEQVIAQQVVDARTALAEAKEAAEKAEAAFRALGTDAVILDDGTKVAIVEQVRRSIEQDTLRDILPTGQYQRVTIRQATLALLDEAVKAGWLAEDTIAPAIKQAQVASVKVTQPKRK